MTSAPGKFYRFFDVSGLPVDGVADCLIAGLNLLRHCHTATEAAAPGVGGSLLLARIEGQLNWSSFKEGLVAACRVSDQ